MQYYAIEMRSEPAQKLTGLRKLRRKKGLSQIKLARRLGISQSTVSRRERKPPLRHSDATFRLCKYAVKKLGRSRISDRRAILKAIDEICNKSDAHAIALSEIIDAFVELSRSENRESAEEELD